MGVSGWCAAYLWEVAGAVADQQTCLAAAAIADDNQLLGVGRGLGDGGVARVGGAVGADCAVAVALTGRPGVAANGCDAGNGGLCALLTSEVVVVLRRCGGHVWCVFGVFGVAWNEFLSLVSGDGFWGYQ